MKRIIITIMLIPILVISARAQLQAPFGVLLPQSHERVDSILCAQGFVKKDIEHLTYLPGLIAYVFKYEGENNTIYLHGTPETKTIYRVTVLYSGGKGKKFYFEQEYNKLYAKYGKPNKYEVAENPVYGTYEAKWWIDGAMIEVNGWIDTYVLPLDICKKEQPHGIPLREDGEKMNCY